MAILKPVTPLSVDYQLKMWQRTIYSSSRRGKRQITGGIGFPVVVSHCVWQWIDVTEALL